MEADSSPRRRPPSSARRTKERRVVDSSEAEAVEEEDSSNPDAVSLASRQKPAPKSRSSNNILNGLHDDNDENVDPDGATPPPSAPSSNSKRRRVSVSGRATAATSTPKAHQKNQARNEEEDEEEDEDGDTPPPEPSMTATSNGDRSRDVKVDPLMVEEADEAQEKKKLHARSGNTLIRDDADGYVMGSIVRIKCHNFLTYYDTECFPGPHLNMIFGPNGSGKSSLVAAIALGLGFPPKVMQRAKHIKEYIKRDEIEAYVEIELKGRPGKRNLVVRRSFQAESNSSKFEINGKAATAGSVAESVQHLHVNVNNLCSFLPQDRVSDFAKMTGPELLHETQRTADEHLLSQQEELTKLKADLTDIDKNLGKNKIVLQENERKMTSLERDVRRHNERQSIEDELIIEEKALPYAMYQEAKEKHVQLRRERNEVKERLDSLTDLHAPLVEQALELKALEKQAAARKKSLAKKRDELGRFQKKTIKEVAGIETEVDRLRDTLKDIKEEEARHKRKLHECSRNIRELKRKIDEGPPPEAAAPAASARSEALKAEINAIRDQILEIQAQGNEANAEIDSASDELKRLQNQLSSLNNVQVRRDESCKREDPSLWMAASFVRTTRGQRGFKSAVYDPIRLLISVKDKRHARVAEAAINYATMKTFVCLDREDYSKLRTHFQNFPQPARGSVDLRVNMAELPEARRDLAQYAPPCTPEQLHQLGFDAFVLDLLDGPPDVLAYMCYTIGIHRIPVAFDDGNRIDHDRLKAPNAPFRRYISQYSVTDVNFSRYGNREAIVTDVQTKDPRLFNETIDQNRKQELELKIAEVQASVHASQRVRDDLVARDDALRVDIDKLRAEKEAVDAERTRIQKAKTAYASLKLNLRTEETKLEELQAHPSEAAKRLDIAEQMKVLALKRLRLTRTLEPFAVQLVRCHTLEAIPLFAHLQAGASLRALENALQSRSQELQTVRQRFETINRAEKDAKVAAKTVFDEAQNQEPVPDRLVEAFQERIGNLTESSEEVLQHITDLEGRLSISQHINPSVVKKYEELRKSVEALRAKVQEQEEGAETGRAEVQELHDRWHPRVLRIVDRVGEKFSKAMQSLGCVGEVSITEHEDYSNWAISIKVAFRDGEKVAELNAHRQSGGERSLTTMLYLISLLELSKVPFSLVDEINQGMDARAERAVHNHLVKAVCDHADVGQYFLLTPKLLPNLNYHPRIKVLCVNNGDWLPDDGLPLRTLINKRLAAKTGSKSGRSNIRA